MTAVLSSVLCVCQWWVQHLFRLFTDSPATKNLLSTKPFTGKASQNRGRMRNVDPLRVPRNDPMVAEGTI